MPLGPHVIPQLPLRREERHARAEPSVIDQIDDADVASLQRLEREGNVLAIMSFISHPIGQERERERERPAYIVALRNRRRHPPDPQLAAQFLQGRELFGRAAVVEGGDVGGGEGGHVAVFFAPVDFAAG